MRHQSREKKNEKNGLTLWKILALYFRDIYFCIEFRVNFDEIATKKICIRSISKNKFKQIQTDFNVYERVTFII